MSTPGQNWAPGVWAPGVWADGVWSESSDPNTPSPFAFKPATGVEPLALVTSGGAVVTGIGQGVPISVVGGEYSINLGPWTSSPGTINNGDSVRVRGTASAQFSTDVQVALTVGTYTTYFVIQTRSDRAPGGDDYPGPRRKKKKTPAKPKKKRTTLTINDDQRLRAELTSMYRELMSDPDTRERAQEVVEREAPASQPETQPQEVRSDGRLENALRALRSRGLSTEGELALRLLYEELRDKQDEQAIQELLAMLL